MIALDDVSLRYGGVHAVSGVTTEVKPGSRVALIGPNGAGKTSLLSVIGGQSRASSGRVRLQDVDITRMSAHRRSSLGIARSFQITSLMPELTVREQAGLALHQPNRWGVVGRAGRATTTRVESLLSEWGIPRARWEVKPALLSYGEQRSLELALALARKPKVLLLDEPNVGLTGAENAELVDRLAGLDRDTTVILVAHDMDMVFGFAERVVVMQRGKVMVDDTPDAVRKSEEVAQIYIGGAEW